MQQDYNDGSTSIIADNGSIDNDQKPHNPSSSYEDNNEEWLMKRAKKVFTASAEDEDDWLFKRARLSFAASVEEANDENKEHSSDPMEITTKTLSSQEQQDMHTSSPLKTYIDEVLAEMEKLDRGKGKMKVRCKSTGTTTEDIENIENKREQEE